MAGAFDRPAAIGDPNDPTTPSPLAGDTPAAPPPSGGGGGLELTPAMAILMGSAASSLIGGIINQRNLREGRKFESEEAQKVRDFNREETRRANVLGSISGMGERARVGADARSSALSRLAQLFGGV